MVLSAREILNMKEPGALFKDPKNIKIEYRELARKWHPDNNSGSKEANDVISHINELYNEGLELIKLDKWITPCLIRFPSKDDRIHEIHFKTSKDFNLGKMYISDKIVAYLIKDTYKDLFKNAQKITENFKFANDNMKKEVSKYLPKILATFETKDNQLGMVIEKTPDLLLLKDVLNYYNGKIPDRHVAWILSGLHNLVCYLDYSKLSHNDISLDTYFISPEFHSGALLGGWWYAVPQGSKMIGVPATTYSTMPPKIKNSKQGSVLTDLELIRTIGREILGDRNGTKLLSMNVAPVPLIEWLRGASSDKASSDYTKWQDVLNASFGPRKFVEMKLTSNMLYKKI